MLLGASAAAAAAALPSLAGTPAPVAVLPAEPPMPMWAVGTPGEWNYLPIAAPNEQEARSRWVSERIGGWLCEAVEDGEREAADPDCHCEFCSEFRDAEAQRHPSWDGKDVEIGDADWLGARLGASCDRCGYECFAESGAHSIKGKAVCSDCMTLADWDVVDPARAAELREEADADV